MKPFWIYILFAFLVVGVSYLVCRFLDWVSNDPLQAISDEDFRAIKKQDKILARGYVDKGD